MEIYRKRLLGFSLLILIFVGAFVFRLLDLQILNGDKFRQLSQANSLRQNRVPAPRGRLLDRRGRLLAENRLSFTLTLNPSQIHDPHRSIHTLAYLLNWKEEQVAEVLGNIKQLSGFTPIVVKEDLSPEEAARIRGRISLVATKEPKAFDLNGINLELRYARVYLGGEALGHLLGYLREAGEKELRQWEKREPGRVGPGDQVGVVGVEKSFDGLLRGYDGFQRSFVDALGHEVEVSDLGLEALTRDIPSRKGEDLQLTVDADLSRRAYEAFGDGVGALVALNPQNGEVLALVSKPSYRPGLLTGGISNSLWNRLRNNPDKVLLNRTIQAAYPPGSTYKIVTALAALAEGEIDFKEKIDCKGFYEFGGRKWGCWNKHGHGSLNLSQALIQSCDVFFYHLGKRLGSDRLAHYAALLGLGRKTHILKDYEQAGLIPTREWKQEKRKEAWNPGDDLGDAIGQGFNLVTPLQSALMIAEFANGGRKIFPHLLKATAEDEKNWRPAPFPPPSPLPLKISAADYVALKKALVGVVEAPKGTGGRARIPGVEVGGKTGTAQVVALERKGKTEGKSEDHAWFVGFAPADHPEIAVSVIVEHGGHGGSAAAPIAQQVMEEFFREKKDFKKTPEAAVLRP